MMLSTFQMPSIGPIAAPPGAWGAAIAALQVVMISGRYSEEMTGTPFQYSKFATDESAFKATAIPSKVGMFLFYAPAAVASLIMLFASFGQYETTLLLFLHFLKRDLEVVGIHSFSGSMPVSSLVVGVYYALSSVLIGATAKANPDAIFVQAGVALFVVGQLGNFYHHYLLSKLRKDKPKTTQRRYEPPTGGMFALVATPHYLFELISWLGIACVSQQLIAFLELLSHTLYLSARAKNTNGLYFKQFSETEWPRSRKNIFPFIY
jgi:hypothetical protein